MHIIKYILCYNVESTVKSINEGYCILKEIAVSSACIRGKTANGFAEKSAMDVQTTTPLNINEVKLVPL